MAKRKPVTRDTTPGAFLREVAVDWSKVATPEAFPWAIPSIKELGTLSFHPKVTFLVGENGSGKSTLIEAIAAAARFNPDGGSKSTRFEATESETRLHESLRLVRSPTRERDGFFLRAESFFNVAATIDRLDREAREQGLPGGRIIDSYGGVSLLAQSHGESFLSLVEHRFREDSLFLLDEPEAALSPQRQLSLLVYLDELVQRGRCQFVIATHSPILMAYPDATIYELSADGVRPIAWEDTEHYRITRDFLQAPQRFFRSLFKTDPDA